jgi:hypothetical protein
MTDLADQILAGSIWNNVPDFSDYQPFSLFRILGYPLIVAGAKLLAGPYGMHLIVGLQVALSIGAAYCLYSTVRKISGLYTVGLLSAVIFATSYLAYFAHFVITDCIYTCIFVIMVCWLSVAIYEGRILRPRDLLGLGIGIAILFLIREGTVVLAVTMIPLVVLAGRRQTVRGTLRSCAVAFVPLVVVYTLVLGWNFWRCGYPVITTAAQGAALVAVADAQHMSGIPMFEDDTVFDSVVNKHYKVFDFMELQHAQAELGKISGYNAPQLAELSKQKYIQAWWRHPGAMWALTARNMDYGRYALASPYFETRSAVLRDFYPHYMRALFDLCIFLLPATWIVIGSMWATSREPAMLVTALSAFSLGTLLFYSAFHMELRYLLPLFAPLFLNLAITFGELQRAPRLAALCRERRKPTDVVASTFSD